MPVIPSLNLSQAAVGEKMRVVRINHTGSMQRRLRELGLTEGTEVRCVLTSPHGDCAVFDIRGAFIALRAEDLMMIEAYRL